MEGVRGGANFPETRLSQMKRLVRLNVMHRDDLNECGQWLIDRALFTFYSDLRDLGYEGNAQDILFGVPVEFTTRNPG